MLKAIIIDDEEHCRDAIKMACQEIDDISIVGQAVDIHEAKQLIGTLQPDLLFLDIEMPGGSGFQLLEQINEPNFHIIFTTGHNKYAVKAFKHSAADYLLKPIESADLEKAVSKVVKLKGNSQNFQKLELLLQSVDQKEFSKIALPSVDSYEFVSKKELIFCEADSNYTRITMSNGKKFITTITLKKISELLTEKQFFRIHKSFIVNINYVKKVLKGEGGNLVMEDESLIPIARRRKEEFLALIGM